MRLIVLTSNAPRHRWIANQVTNAADAAMVVTETRRSDEASVDGQPDAIRAHFRRRLQVELEVFGRDPFEARTLPLVYGEVNLPSVYGSIIDFAPDAIFVFGSSILKEPLVSLVPGRFVNLHLGLSPYYRGSGTNFWPFANDELEYVGATIHHIDPGIDTGDIICHVVPEFEIGDDVHTVGSKVILSAGRDLLRMIELLRNGVELQRVPQWEPDAVRYYRSWDFDEQGLKRYEDNLASGRVDAFARCPRPSIRLVSLGGD